MRMARWWLVLALFGCGGGSGSGSHIDLPQVYPPVRANTPAALIADPTYQSTASVKSTASKKSALSVAALPQALGDAVNLAMAVQDRLYTAGPTEILRIVHELDDRTAGLDTDPSKHSCLTATPIDKSYALPGGQTFDVKLQCMQSYGGGFIAFGFDHAQAADAGATAIHGGEDFYLVQGQEGGMGGAYHLQGNGNLEGWISVADSRVPAGSQVIMHMLTDQTAGTLELTFGGSGVGFCNVHLKTGGDYLFIRGKTNGAPPPGTPMSEAGGYCDAVRSGCFAVSALTMDLGGDAASCSAIAASSFGIAIDLDASSDPEANVVAANVYAYFDSAPSGVPAF
jgi:hypothetical protein